MNLTLRAYKKGKIIERFETQSKKDFLKFGSDVFKRVKEVEVVLRVNYGNGVVNEGTYKRKIDFSKAVRAFTEK